MTTIIGDITKLGFIAGMREPIKEGWGRAKIVECESAQRALLAHASERDDKLFYRVRIKDDSEDIKLEVQCFAWCHRNRKRFINLAGILTHNGASVPYWATVDTNQRIGYLHLSDDNFKAIGYKPTPLGPF